MIPEPLAHLKLVYENEKFMGFICCYPGWSSLTWFKGSRVARCANCGLTIKIEGAWKNVPTIQERKDLPKIEWLSCDLTQRSYLTARGLKQSEIEEFFVGHPDYPSYVVSPVTEDGRMVQWHGRHMLDGRPKYRTGASKDGWARQSSCVWGLDRIIPNQAVFVCEGYFDALFFDSGVAVMGSKISDDQAVKILDRCPSAVVLCLDYKTIVERVQDVLLEKDPDKEWEWLGPFQKLSAFTETSITYPPAQLKVKDFGALLPRRLTETG